MTQDLSQIQPKGARLVCVFFPDLAMDRWRRITQAQRSLPGDEVPVVLAHAGSHGPVVHAVSAEARRRGVALGARVVDVQAIHPDLHVEPADEAGDRAFLERVAHWARRWCPWTVRDGVDGITLDITGAAHLFGGEARMLRDMGARFKMQGLESCLAVAPTRGAAQMLARYSPGTICGPEDSEVALAPLPVAALRIGEDTVRLLQRLGLKTIGP